MRSPQDQFINVHPCSRVVRLENLTEAFAALPFGGPEMFGRHNAGSWQGSVSDFYDDVATSEAIRYGVVGECEALGYPTEIPK